VCQSRSSNSSFSEESSDFADTVSSNASFLSEMSTFDHEDRKIYGECRRKRKLLGKKLKRNCLKAGVSFHKRSALEVLADACADEAELHDPCAYFVPKLVRQETHDLPMPKDNCVCHFGCASLYCDFVNILATKDRESLVLDDFIVKFKMVAKLGCDCDSRKLVLNLIQKEFSVTVQTKSGYFSSLLFGETVDVNAVVDDKIERVSSVLNKVVSNIKHDLTDDAKEYIDEKFSHLEFMSKNANVGLTIPDVTGVGNILGRLFNSENVGTSCIVMFCILYLTRKYHPSIGDICALFAGMAMCYVGTSVIMPILTSWLIPTTQSAGEWIRVVSEVVGISMFAVKGKWEFDLQSITSNFVAIEREKPLLDSLLERMQNLVFTIIRLVAEACGKEFISDFSPIAEKIRALRKRVASINKDPARHTSPSAVFVNDVFKLQEDIMDVYENATVTKGSERYVSQIQGLISIIRPLCDYLESNKFISGSRFCPFLRSVTGFSGVGKTAISERLNRLCFKTFATDDCKLAVGDDYSNICYPVESGKKHFESYNGQFCTQMNDLLQKREKLGDEFSACEFVIQAVGNSVMMLKVALMSKKDKVAMRSLLIDVSTNLYTFNKTTCPTLQDAVPLNRRFAGKNNAGFPVIMCVKEKYGMLGEIPEGVVYPTPPEGKPKDYFKLTIDWSKVPKDKEGVYNIEDIYEFYDWNFTTGQLLKGYRVYDLAAYENEFLRRFGIHYSNQINYLRQAARRGKVELGNLPNDFVMQGKSFDDLMELQRQKLAKDDELFAHLTSDDNLPTPLYDSELEFERQVKNHPEAFSGGFGYDSDVELDSDDEPYLDEATMNVVTKEISDEIEENLESYEISKAMAATVAESSLRLENLNKKQVKAMRGWSLSEMKQIVKCKLTDPMIYSLRRLLTRGMEFSKAFSTVVFSLLGVFVVKSNSFLKDPLAWFKGHPFVSVTLAGCAALSMYGLIKVGIKFFRSFGNKDDFYCDEYERLACADLYRAHLADPKLLGTHNMSCCSRESILAYHRKHWVSTTITPEVVPIGVPMATPIAEVILQGAIPGDKKWDYAIAGLENFYTFWTRYTSVNPDGQEVVNIVDECKGMALRGQLYNLPYHVLRLMISYTRLKNCKSVEIGLVPIIAKSTPPTWTNIKDLKWIIREDSEARDEVYFQMHSGTKIHADMVKRMPVKDPEYLRILSTGKFPVKFYRDVGMSVPMSANIKLGNYSYPLPRAVMGTEEKDLLEPASSNFVGFQIDIETLSGDCNAPCFMWSNSFTHLSGKHKVFQHPFLVYRHAAWHNLLKYGLGAAYFQEDYKWIDKYVLSSVKVKDRVASIEENISGMVDVANLFTHQCKTYVPYIKKLEVAAPIAEHHIPIGTIDEVRINRKNNIKRSELFPFIKKEYGVDGKLTKMPTNLNPRVVDGVLKDPLVEGIQSYGGNKDVVVNPLDVDLVSNFIVADIINNSSPITDEMRGLVPIKEVIVGGNGLRGLNRKSGIGPSLTHMCKIMEWDPVKFKQSFGTEGDYDFDNPMSQTFVKICEDGLEKAKEGEMLTVLFQNHLKVECKQGDKVRLFHGADKNSIPIFGSGFGNLVKWVVKNRIVNGMLIGCNPAKEWGAQYTHLTSVGHYGFAADFSKFDKFQLWFLLNVVMVLARAFYGDFDPAGNRAREAMFECLKNPMFVFAFGLESCVYAWQHGNCSGNFLTTLINCLAGIFIIYYTMLVILRAHPDFKGKSDYDLLCFIRDNIRYEVMGDDNVITMSVEIRKYVNWYNYQAAVYNIFHMEITDDQKGRRIDFVIPLHTHILEFSILGRGFKVVDGEVVAPLRDSSLFEALAWYKGKDRDPNSLLLNVERTLAELAPHGRKRFSLEARKNANAAYEKLGVYPRRNTTFDAAFAAYRSLKFPEYNLYQENSDEESQEIDFDQVFKIDPILKRDLLEDSKLSG